MTEFCETCPLRGSVDGQIEGALKLNYTFEGSFGNPDNTGVTGVLHDKAGNISEPLHMGPQSLAQSSVLNRIDACNEPTIERKGLIRKRNVVTCPAIGRLAVSDLALSKLTTDRLSVAATYLIPLVVT